MGACNVNLEITESTIINAGDPILDTLARLKSLGVHLNGPKSGVWCDFATAQGGDALNLAREVLELDTAGACQWARQWLG